MSFSKAEKLQMSEADIRSKFITPAIRNAGWNERQIREEHSLKRIKNLLMGKWSLTLKQKKASRKQAKRVDYLLYHQPTKKLQ